jgi:hypothetical protein
MGHKPFFSTSLSIPYLTLSSLELDGAPQDVALILEQYSVFLPGVTKMDESTQGECYAERISSVIFCLPLYRAFRLITIIYWPFCRVPRHGTSNGMARWTQAFCAINQLYS